jgi:NitT/TauT family transport system ATP-binding protein
MTSSPGTIRGIIDINLPRPRGQEIKNTPAFAEHRNKVWQLLQSASERTEEIIEEGNVHSLVTAPQEFAL